MHQRNWLLAFGLLTGCIMSDEDGELVCNGADLMTDGDHCGECERSCGGGTCSAGVCGVATLASGQDKPTGITVDDQRIAWTTEGNTREPASGTLAVCPVEGCGGGVSVLYNDLGRPDHPTLVGEQIYFLHAIAVTAGGDLKTWVPEVGNLAREPLGLPLMWWGFQRDVMSLVIADGNMYFGTSSYSSSTTDAFVAMCPVAGCPDTDVYALATERKTVSDVIVDAQYAYFMEYGSATIYRTSRHATLTPEKLFEGELSALDLAQDDTHLYWGTSLPPQQGVTVKNYLARGSKQGGTKEKLADIAMLTGIAVDGEWIYFAESDGKVSRIAKTGGTAQVLATSTTPASSLKLGGDFLYWVNRSGGTVHRLRIK